MEINFLEILIVLGRVIFGGYFFIAGIKHFRHLSVMAEYAKSKCVPMPKLAVMLSGAMIILGGAGVFTGMFVRYSLGLIIVFLLVTAFKMHDYWNVDDPIHQVSKKINFDKNIALVGAALMMLAIPEPWVPVLAAFF